MLTAVSSSLSVCFGSADRSSRLACSFFNTSVSPLATFVSLSVKAFCVRSVSAFVRSASNFSRAFCSASSFFSSSVRFAPSSSRIFAIFFSMSVISSLSLSSKSLSISFFSLRILAFFSSNSLTFARASSRFIEF